MYDTNCHQCALIILLHAFLTISLVATVALDRNQTMLTEGNDTMNQTLMFNVVLMDDKEGLDRDVIINISAIEISANGT